MRVMADLKPCPFCGGTEIVNDYAPGPFGESLTQYGAKCKTCGASFWHPEATEDDEGGTSWNTRPIEDAKDATIERMREICGEYWRTLCHYDHDDISTNWDQYADGAPIPPRDERYAQMCRELAEAKQDLVEAQCDVERMRGLLGEIIARHEETRDEVLNDHWGTEFDINGVLDVIDHMCVWSDIMLARIDAELKKEE